ncbi:MAG TPA: transport-associated protein [Desulfobacteraceae bacterium]|nr:transport-associated protein [Desulfobacteraceae bacterium]
MLRTDEHIKKDIVDNLFWNSSVDASDIKIEVNGGRVTLSGTVTNYAAQISAITETWDVKGVKKIENNLRVKYPDEVETLMDEDVHCRAVSVLAWNPDLESSDITVEVENGIVRLNGSVDTFWKKEKAERLTGELRGVMIVENNLAVVPSEKTQDQSIAAYILEVMKRNLKFDIDGITVSVNNGLVSLSGTVPDKRAFKEAADAARFTLGVTGVDNNLEVED